MIILDILFKICYAPIQKDKKGRDAAIIWLTQILGLTGLGLFNALFYWIGIDLSGIGVAIVGGVVTYSAYLLLANIYIEGNREVGTVKYPFLMGVLIFVLTIASLFFMIVSLAKY